MSQDSIEEEADVSCCCASCGKAEIDDIKLKPCDDCDLVRYCSDDCKGNHQSEHEEACKKRATELRDELLFKQPESTHLGDCPICMLPLPLDVKKSVIHSCCSKSICDGCCYANQMREMEMRLRHACPFCREPMPSSEDGCSKQNMKRVEMNDPVALCQEGVKQSKKGDYRKAFEYFTKASKLGDVEAHHHLSVLYRAGNGVDKDEGKAIHHTEEAAIGGHPKARYNLGVYEWVRNNNAGRAVKHWKIAATQGEDDSMKWLVKAFRKGLVIEEDLVVAFSAHQASVDATKSPQRKAAEGIS